ncbi:MAG: site-specific integrase [Dehalococcoidia bacterium]|nr:site-specific integrase [Dehalococcoidia bacterium]
MGSKHARLLQSKKVRLWYENVSRGSNLTANVYLRRLGLLCRELKMSPDELASLSERRAHLVLLELVSELERRGVAGSYAESVLKVARSWLVFNGKIPKGRIKIRGAHLRPRIADERVPTQEELHRIFMVGDERARVLCAVIAHAGLRPEVLGTHDASDGLRLGDFPELQLDRDGADFVCVPAMVRVRAELSKAKHQYFSFIGQEACSFIKDYLSARSRSGERLAPDSPLVTPKFVQKPFVSTINIGDAVRKAIRGAGFPWRPYVLRSYFATQMMLAESKGFVIRDYRTFFMGHRGDIEAVYTLRKRTLPDEVIQQMRDGYAKALPHLETTGRAPSAEDFETGFRRQLLRIAGFADQEVDSDKLSMDETTFGNLIRSRLLAERASAAPRQKVVSMAQMDQYLARGWEFVTMLPDRRAVVQRRGMART